MINMVKFPVITIAEFHKKYGKLPTETDPDWERERVMGKIQILNSPALAPGVCCLCGSSRSDDGRKYIDIGLDIDDPFGPHGLRGTVYWCTFCLKELFIKIAEVDEEVLEYAYNRVIRKDISEDEIENDPIDADINIALKVELQRLTELVQEMRESINGMVSNTDPNPSSSGVSELRDMDRTETESDSPSVAENESRTSESNPSKRSGNIQNPRDLLKPRLSK